MLKKLHFFFIIGLTILFAACDDSKDEPQPIPADRTVLVYMAADNSLSSFADADIEEMMAGMKNVDTSVSNLCLYVDDKSTPVLYHFTHNSKGEIIKDVIATYSEQISTDVAVMSEVVKRVFSDFPAASYGLVYWSHGEGWIPDPIPSSRWIGQDIGGGKCMNISELAAVLDEAPHLDFLLFDACFMQSIEVAYELRAYADYFISSPTEIPAPGAPYDKVVPAMFYKDDFARKIGEAYISTYAENFNENLVLGSRNPYAADGKTWIAGVSASVIQSSALEHLANVTNQVLPTENIDNSILRLKVFSYDKRSNPMYFDLVEMMRYLVDDDATFSTWKTAYDNAVVYWKTTSRNFSDFGGVFLMTNANGVSHFIPGNKSATNNVYRSTAWYKNAGLEKLGW